MPSAAATQAVARAWFDCAAPAVTRVSAPCAMASATTNSSLRTLFPASPIEPMSSRLIHTSTPIAAPNRSARTSGVGSGASAMRASPSHGCPPATAAPQGRRAAAVHRAAAPIRGYTRGQAETYENGGIGSPPPGWISKCRCGGVVFASPVLPTKPMTVPALTTAPSFAAGAKAERCAW